MKRGLRSPIALIGAILDAGIRAILLWVVIGTVLLLVAVVIGVVVWIGHGFLHGLVAGLAAFVLGQTIALSIIDLLLHLPDRPKHIARDQTDEEVLEALRAELESNDKQGGTTDAWRRPD